MTAGAAAAAGQSIDAFHRGDFHIVQPKGRGHRSGMDAMMLAAAVPGAFAGRLADLGAGAGAAGMAVASRCAGAHVVLVERDAGMAGFARNSRNLDENRHIAERIQVIEADVTLRGAARVQAGLGDGAFGFAIMNPPFNAGRDRATPDVLRQQAHVMSEGLFEAWCRTASAIVAPRGGIAIIARPQSLPELFAALDGRFGALEIVPVQPRADEPAIRVILRGVRGSRKAMTLCPPLVLHAAEGSHHAPRAERVCSGRESLFGD